MRQRKRDLACRVNGSLRVEFADEKLTSYGGLELIARYLREIRFNEMVRTAFRTASLGGDYSVVAMVRLFVALLLVGGRRLRHVQFVRHDVLVKRFAGLNLLPEERTLSRWLDRFSNQTLPALGNLSREIVLLSIERLKLRTLTIDLDGTVISTGLQVAWAVRGYNPHHRKVPSYYPALAHLSETGQFLAVKNRPGNVHDGKGSEQVLRELIRDLRARLGNDVRLRFRMDGAFFVRPILERLVKERVDYALKVPMHRWLDLRSLIQMRSRWEPVGDGVEGFATVLSVKQWGMTLRVVCYRKRVFHQTAKNFQLDLFSPDDGTYEYSAVASNLELSPTDLWLFMSGRGAQEKSIGELKTGFAFDTVPTKSYGANSAWQWLSVITHNLHRDLQLVRRSILRRRTKKKTYLMLFESILTTRFEWLNVAGRLLTLSSGLTLRLQATPEVQKRFEPWLKSA
jgi:hypothetical protein